MSVCVLLIRAYICSYRVTLFSCIRTLKTDFHLWTSLWTDVSSRQKKPFSDKNSCCCNKTGHEFRERHRPVSRSVCLFARYNERVQFSSFLNSFFFLTEKQQVGCNLTKKHTYIDMWVFLCDILQEKQVIIEHNRKLSIFMHSGQFSFC